jgi:hypothetical protein
MDSARRLIARVHCPHCPAGAAVVYVPVLGGWRCTGPNCDAKWEDVAWPR